MRGTLTTRLGSITEPLIEGVIRLCGWSAIFFVFAIFFFVFREGAPFLFGKLDLVGVLHQHQLAARFPRPGPIRRAGAHRRDGLGDAAGGGIGGARRSRSGGVRLGVLLARACESP